MLCLSQWMPPVEGVEEKASKLHTQQVPPEDLLPCIAYFNLVLLPFLFIGLSPAASSVSWYRSCFVCSGLAYEIYSGGGPSMYIYWVVCNHVIAAAYVRSVGCVVVYLYTLDDNSECPMNHETSLLPQGWFPSIVTDHYITSHVHPYNILSKHTHIGAL